MLIEQRVIYIYILWPFIVDLPIKNGDLPINSRSKILFQLATWFQVLGLWQPSNTSELRQPVKGWAQGDTTWGVHLGAV